MRQAEQKWYQEEKKLYGSNGPVIAYDCNTEECMGSFATYDDFRSEWSGAEIVGHDINEPGKGCNVYC